MLLLPLVLLALAWIQESLDQFLFGGRWALPMVHGGPFWGVLTAPFSHSDWSHLVSNSLWFLPLSYLVLLNGVRAYVAVWIGVYATAALVWLWLPVASHGLSGVVYGLLGYLLLIGWLERRPLSVMLSLGCLVACAKHYRCPLGCLVCPVPPIVVPGRISRLHLVLCLHHLFGSGPRICGPRKSIRVLVGHH